MRDPRPTENQAVTHASAWAVVSSVGVTGMMIIEHYNYAIRSEGDDTMDKLIEQLENALTVMAGFAMEYEELLKIMQVELPPGYAAVKVKNPLWLGGMEEPSDKSKGSTHESGDDFPF